MRLRTLYVVSMLSIGFLLGLVLLAIAVGVLVFGALITMDNAKASHTLWTYVVPVLFLLPVLIFCLMGWLGWRAGARAEKKLEAAGGSPTSKRTAVLWGVLAVSLALAICFATATVTRVTTALRETDRAMEEERKAADVRAEHPVVKSLSFQQEPDSSVVIAVQLDRPLGNNYALQVEVICGAEGESQTTMTWEARPGVAPRPVQGLLWRGMGQAGSAQARLRAPRTDMDRAYCALAAQAGRPAVNDDIQITAILLATPGGAAQSGTQENEIVSSEMVKWKTWFRCNRVAQRKR